MYVCGAVVTIERSTVADQLGAGIYDSSWDGFTSIIRVTGTSLIEGNGRVGIETGSADLSVAGTSITGNGAGVVLVTPYAATIDRSLVSGNTGDGVWVDIGAPTVSDSTVAGNGTGIRATDSTVTLRRSTVAANTTTATGGVRPAGAGGLRPRRRDGLGVRTGHQRSSLGWNLVDDTSCGLGAWGDVQGVDPLLGPLRRPRRPDRDHATWCRIAAIDAIPTGTGGLCAGALVDQRGVGRPQGTRCEQGCGGGRRRS